MHATMTIKRRGGWRSVFVALLLMVLAGCQDGAREDALAEGAAPQDEQGEVVIGLTDAPGDIVSYTVDVLSLTLTRADGAVVETLPLQTRVDFAQYTEMTEFITAATVPAGTYVKAQMQVDYRNADIRVEDEAGNIVPVASAHIVDEEGEPLTMLDLDVHLEDRSSLRIAPGVPAHLTLDFDLESSHRVSFDEEGAPVLTVAPVLFADVKLERPKPHRLRGLLEGVAPAENRFAVILRPFQHHLAVRERRFGSLQVHTDDETLFEVDGRRYRGQEGLRALDALPAFSAVVVTGELRPHGPVHASREPHLFKAREVLAGSSVPGGTLDAVRGNVVKREATPEGEVLTVRGAVLMRRNGSIRFNDEIQVLISGETRVVRQLSLEPLTIEAISIGQRVLIHGEITEQAALSSLPDHQLAYQLDARQGRVRLLLTTLLGSRMADDVAPSGYFVMSLQRIDGRRPGLFDFTGTGMDAAHDADPGAYELETGALDTTGFRIGGPLQARGFVRPFGQAPADFEARTLVDLDAMPATLVVNWRPPSAAAFLRLDAAGLVIDLAGAGRFHHVRQGGVVTDLTAAEGDPVVRPREDGAGRFLIRQHGVVQLHSRFDAFAEDLAARLAEGAQVARLQARGEYTSADLGLTADVIKVWLGEARPEEVE